LLTPQGGASIALCPYAQHWRRWQRSVTLIGVNFYKAARLEPSHFLGCKAFRPLSPHFFQLHFLKTNDKNEITANNQTSFMEIDPCKLQALTRSVLISQHCNSR